MKTVGISGFIGVPSSVEEIGSLGFWSEADDLPPPSSNKPLIRIHESPGPDSTAVDDLKGISI